MTGITMYDSVTLSEVPANPPAVACYVNGRFANHSEALRRFPNAHILTIAVTTSADADCLDIETGDARPAQAVGWFLRQKARGVTRPCLYASASVMQAEVAPIVSAAGILRSSVRLWSAHYTFSAHRCGPATCREMSITADGTQWTDRSHGRNLDESLVAADFFGPEPSPIPAWQEAIMNALPTLGPDDRDHAGSVAFVRRVQALTVVVGTVNKLPDASAVKATGVFDQATRRGVLAVQKFFGLAQDGIVGPASWGALIAGQHP